MNRVVLDASALLAFLFDEAGAEAVASTLGLAALSSVNLSEVLQKLADKGVPVGEAMKDLLAIGLDVHDFVLTDAIEVARLRTPTRRLGLSLGDRACLALGRRLDARILTADRDWSGLGLEGIDIQLIR